MRKTVLTALVAVMGVSAAAPALADSGGPFGDRSADAREFAAYSILVRLQQAGIPATDVEEWGGLIRAYVEAPDGTITMAFFEPDTLTPVIP